MHSAVLRGFGLLASTGLHFPVKTGTYMTENDVNPGTTPHAVKEPIAVFQNTFRTFLDVSNYMKQFADLSHEDPKLVGHACKRLRGRPDSVVFKFMDARKI